MQVGHYMAIGTAPWGLGNPVQQLRQRAEADRAEVLAKAEALLARGKSPQEALAFLASTLTNKLLHAPSINPAMQLRCAATPSCCTPPAAVRSSMPARHARHPARIGPSIRRKLEQLAERHQEVAALLSPTRAPRADAAPAFVPPSARSTPNEPVVPGAGALRRQRRRAGQRRAMLRDAEMKSWRGKRSPPWRPPMPSWAELEIQLIPKDPRDEANLFLEIRAGTGGDEAAIFAGDLFRMYARYAERQGWKVESSRPILASTAATRRSSRASGAAAPTRA